MEHTYRILALVLAVSRSESYFSVSTYSEVAAAVQRHFSSGCLYLLGANEEIDKTTLQEVSVQAVLWKLLSSKSLLTGALHLWKINNAETFSCGHNLPLIVTNLFVKTDSYIMKQILNEIIPLDAYWLVLVQNGNLLEDLLDDINIPFDCELLVAQEVHNVVILTEVYRVSPSLPLSFYHFGNWTSDSGISRPAVGFYLRRNNLHGIVQKAAVNVDDALTVTKVVGQNASEVDGYIGRVWKILEHYLNFTTDYSTILSNSWGVLLENGTWDGVLGMVVRKEVDVGIGAFSMSKQRSEVINFFTPLLNTRQPEDRYDFKKFLQPFSKEIWLAVVISVLLLALCMTAIYRVDRRRKRTETNDRSMRNIHHEDIVHFLDRICRQGIESSPFLVPSRLIYVMLYYMAMILSFSYSASLVSILTIRKTGVPFTTFQEFFDDGTYQLGLVKRTNEINYFRNSKDSLLTKIYTKLIAPNMGNLPGSVLDSMKRICKDPRFTAMMSASLADTYHTAIPCRLQKLSKDYFPFTVSMIASRENRYWGLLNYNLRKMFQAGILKRIRASTSNATASQMSNEWSSANITDVAPVLIILVFGIIIAILILLFEIFWNMKSRFCTHENFAKNSKRQIHSSNTNTQLQYAEEIQDKDSLTNNTVKEN